MDPSRYKTVRKLILTNRGLSRFLEKQAAEGFALTAMTAVRYFFECPPAFHLKRDSVEHLFFAETLANVLYL